MQIEGSVKLRQDILLKVYSFELVVVEAVVDDLFSSDAK